MTGEMDWSVAIACALPLFLGGGEELAYRQSNRGIAQCLSAAPVVGFPTYLRSAADSLTDGVLTCFSPFELWGRPLGNMQLQDAIRSHGLLEDGRYGIYRIPPESGVRGSRRLHSEYSAVILQWEIMTWVFFAGLMLHLAGDRGGGTWIGLCDCAVLSGWSILARVIDRLLTMPVEFNADGVADPLGEDSVYLVGPGRALLVLRGKRVDVQRWTSQRPARMDEFPLLRAFLRALTRVGSALVLILVLATMPHGSEADQQGFILLGTLGQLHTRVVRRLQARRCLAALDDVTEKRQQTKGRKRAFGRVLKRFSYGGRWPDGSCRRGSEDGCLLVVGPAAGRGAGSRPRGIV